MENTGQLGAALVGRGGLLQLALQCLAIERQVMRPPTRPASECDYFAPPSSALLFSLISSLGAGSCHRYSGFRSLIKAAPDTGQIHAEAEEESDQVTEVLRSGRIGAVIFW